MEKIAEQRISICRTNQCGFYDKDGSSENAYIKGKETCAQCGCSLSLKTRSLSSACSLKEIGQEPLWKAVLTQEEEDSLNEGVE